MTKSPEQLYLADDMQPPPDPIRTPEMDERVHAWLDAKDQARRTSEKRKDQEHLLLVACVERGLEKYPYVDADGKKRYFVPDRTPKAKTVAAPAPKKAKSKRTNVETTVTFIGSGVTVELGSMDDAAEKLRRVGEKRAAKAEAEANRVESRRVPRATVAEEIGETDPFAATRAMLETEH